MKELISQISRRIVLFILFAFTRLATMDTSPSPCPFRLILRRDAIRMNQWVLYHTTNMFVTRKSPDATWHLLKWLVIQLPNSNEEAGVRSVTIFFGYFEKFWILGSGKIRLYLFFPSALLAFDMPTISPWASSLFWRLFVSNAPWFRQVSSLPFGAAPYCCEELSRGLQWAGKGSRNTQE